MEVMVVLCSISGAIADNIESKRMEYCRENQVRPISRQWEREKQAVSTVKNIIDRKLYNHCSSIGLTFKRKNRSVQIFTAMIQQQPRSSPRCPSSPRPLRSSPTSYP